MEGLTFSTDKLRMIAKDFLKLDQNTGDTNGFVMRIDLMDFIKLTTPDNLYMSLILDEKPNVSNVEPYDLVKDSFDIDEFNLVELCCVPNLIIDDEGVVLAHEGRHRAALLIKDGESTMPIILKMNGGRDRIGSDLPSTLLPEFNSPQRKGFFVETEGACLLNIDNIFLSEEALMTENLGNLIY